MATQTRAISRANLSDTTHWLEAGSDVLTYPFQCCLVLAIDEIWCFHVEEDGHCLGTEEHTTVRRILLSRIECSSGLPVHAYIQVLEPGGEESLGVTDLRSILACLRVEDGDLTFDAENQ